MTSGPEPGAPLAHESTRFDFRRLQNSERRTSAASGGGSSLASQTVGGTDDSPSIRAAADVRLQTARLQNQWKTGRPRVRFSRRGRGRFEIRHAGLSTAGRPRSTVGRAHRPGWSTDRVARRSARYQTPKRQSVSAVSWTASALFERRADCAAPERSDRFSSHAVALVRAPKLPE
jgi:hypothetical protein